MFNHHIDPLRIPPVSYSARMISKYISNDNGFFLRLIRDFLLNQEIIEIFRHSCQPSINHCPKRTVIFPKFLP